MNERRSKRSVAIRRTCDLRYAGSGAPVHLISYFPTTALRAFAYEDRLYRTVEPYQTSPPAFSRRDPLDEGEIGYASRTYVMTDCNLDKSELYLPLVLQNEMVVELFLPSK